MKRTAWILGWVSILCFPAAAEEERIADFTVEAGGHLRADTPVSVALDGLALPLDTGFRLVEQRGVKRVPVASQVEPGHTPRLWWIVQGPLEKGETRKFLLFKGGEVKRPLVETELGDIALSIRSRDAEVLAYNHAIVPPPEGQSELYCRSGFIHPLRSPSGEVLTFMHPADHIHHMGLWNPFTHTSFEGRTVDFWNLKKGQGTVRFVRFASITTGSVYGGFRALHDCVDLSAPGGEKIALNEEWDVRVWSTKEGWLCDFTSTLACASSSPVTLLKYRYGGLGFRARESWKKGDYLTSEGKQRKEGQGTRGRWCMVYGPTDKGPAGVLFMDHVQNHEHPQPMRIWSHTDEIFFNFNPTQKADWVLEPGKKYVLRYRMYIYDGTITPEQAERLWCDFAHPPVVSVNFQ